MDSDPSTASWRGVVIYRAVAFGRAWLVQVALVYALQGVPGGP